MTNIILFLEFFKIGLFAIGGGLSTIPFLQELSIKYNWFTPQEIVDMIAISESTPGPIGINMATYVGYKTTGLIGSLIAVFGIVTPSVIIIILIARYYMRFSEHPIVEAGFYGVRPAVSGLIAAAGFEVAKISLFDMSKYVETLKIYDAIDFKSLILFILIIFSLNRYKKHPIFFLLGAALVGIILKY